MGFYSEFNTKMVSLIKSNGTKINNIEALIQEGKPGKIIIIEASHIPRNLNIESKDRIHRKMSNGSELFLEVDDPGFREENRPFPAAYHAKCTILSTPPP